MGTHIIWRNPSPPRKVEFKLRRVAAGPRATVYRVANPNYRHPWELIRMVASPGATSRQKVETAASGAALVMARW
ncbi:MAG: hypothetical protein WA463_13780 [Terriglobales bacterium]